MSLIQNIRSWASTMFNKDTIERALKVNIAVSQEMEQEQMLWRRMFFGKAPWNGPNLKSLHIASSLCTEVARAVTVEFESTVTGSPRADYINRQYQRVVDDLRKTVEKNCYGGTIILKPYIKGTEIFMTVAENNCYYPIEYNENGELTDVVFQRRILREKFYYTLLERCTFETVNVEGEIQVNYTVENTAWKSGVEDTLGKSIPLKDIPEWSELPDSITFKNVKRAWFVVLNMPALNHVEQGSPVGMAIFSKSVGLIRDADEQYARTKWEFEGGELAIDASIDLFKKSVTGDPILPAGKKRLYRTYDDAKTSGDRMPIKVFNPDFRDESLNRELNEIKRDIEFNSGVTYGTLSKVSETDRTATEIRASKQRFFTTVTDIQKAVQTALEALLEIMDDITTRYELAVEGDYEVGFNWDDSILADRQTEFQEKLQLVEAGLLPGYKFIAWYLGISEEDAKEVIAENPTIEGESNE